MSLGSVMFYIKPFVRVSRCGAMWGNPRWLEIGPPMKIIVVTKLLLNMACQMSKCISNVLITLEVGGSAARCGDR